MFVPSAAESLGHNLMVIGIEPMNKGFCISAGLLLGVLVWLVRPVSLTLRTFRALFVAQNSAPLRLGVTQQ